MSSGGAPSSVPADFDIFNPPPSIARLLAQILARLEEPVLREILQEVTAKAAELQQREAAVAAREHDLSARELSLARKLAAVQTFLEGLTGPQ